MTSAANGKNEPKVTDAADCSDDGNGRMDEAARAAMALVAGVLS